MSVLNFRLSFVARFYLEEVSRRTIHSSADPDGLGSQWLPPRLPENAEHHGLAFREVNRVPYTRKRFHAGVAAMTGIEDIGPLPAGDLELAVLEQVHHTLMSPQVMLGVWKACLQHPQGANLDEAEVVVAMQRIGAVWNQIFIVPSLSDVVQVPDVLTHELVHAVDDCQHGHGKEFKEIALSVGLQGPRMRSASAGDKLKARLTEIAAELGPLPHGALTRRPPRARNPDPPRARCPQCDYRLAIPKKFLHMGPPICSEYKVPMEASGDWDGW